MESVDWEKAYKIFQEDKKDIFDTLKREGERHPRIKDVLLILASGTLVSAAILMPGLPAVFSPFLWEGKGFKKGRFKQTLKRLQKQQMVETVETKDGYAVRITKNGITKALKYKLEEMQVIKQKHWDKKWRVIVFDIGEDKKKLRDELRKRLKQIGFYTLQDSVYVHAFPCQDEIEFLRQIYGVDIEVTVILALKIEGEEKLKSYFGIE